jgi:Zn-dependent peptidase ImmA (M78 family)
MELEDLNFLEEELGEKLDYSLAKLSERRSELGPVEMAARCREKMGLKENEPVINIYDSLERAGIKVFLKASLPIIFFGLAIRADDMGPAIFVNANESIALERRIFSAAHELGHLLLHPDSFDVSKKEEIKDEEKEANLFAGHFLVPDKEFDVQWEAHNNLNIVDRAIKVRDYFNVSLKAVLYRIIDEKQLIKYNGWKFFNYEFKKSIRYIL